MEKQTTVIEDPDNRKNLNELLKLFLFNLIKINSSISDEEPKSVNILV